MNDRDAVGYNPLSDQQLGWGRRLAEGYTFDYWRLNMDARRPEA